MVSDKSWKERGDAFADRLRDIGAYDCACTGATAGGRSAPVVMVMQVWATPDLWEQWLTFLELRQGKIPESMKERMNRVVQAKSAFYDLCRERGFDAHQATILAAHYTDPVVER